MNSPNDEEKSKAPNLRIASFAGHAARGLVRQQAMRRKLMFWTVILAVLMLFCGATFLARWLDPKEHAAWFVFYWLACGWVTVTAVLLAIFDLLLVRVQARQEKRALGERMAARTDSEDAA